MSQFGFFLFLLLNGLLFLRPGDLFVEMAGIPFYEYTAIACLVVLGPQVLRQLQVNNLLARPITLCVIGVLVAAVLSNIRHGDLEGASSTSVTLFKVFVTYLLMVAAVDSISRLRWYLSWLCVWLMGLTALALMQYHGIIDFAALAPHVERIVDNQSNATVFLPRIAGMGLFANPNDLARMLVVGIILCIYFMADTPSTFRRLLWVVPILVYGNALMLTHSRGGFLALIGSGVVLIQQLIGGVRSVVLSVVAVSCLFLLFAGVRQTNLSTEEGTGQQRIQLWSEGFLAMRDSPLFGIGVGHYPEYTGGLGAHNSFVECYVEMGVVGGTLFFATFYLALTFLLQARTYRREIDHPGLLRLQPFLLSILAGYVVGMFSSSRCYVIPTYVLLGLATVYLRLVGPWLRVPRFAMTPRLAVRLGILSTGFLITLYATAAWFVNWGSRN